MDIEAKPACYLRFLATQTTQVHHQLAINEYPQIIVTGEIEGISRFKAGLAFQVQGEVVVVAITLVARQQAVNREESGVAVGKQARTRTGFGQVERKRSRAFIGGPPVIELGRRIHLAITVSADIIGQSIHT